MRDFRSYIEELDSFGHFATVSEPVDLKHELAAVQWKIEKTLLQAVRFEKTRDGFSNIVGNLFLSPLRTGIQPTIPLMPELMGMFSDMKQPGIVYPIWATNPLFLQVYKDLEKAVLDGLKNQIPPAVVQASWKHNYEGKDVDLARQVPIPWYFKEDAGHYISVGATFAKDERTGTHNAGIYRIQVIDGKTLAIMVNAKRDLLGIIQNAAVEGRKVPVAIAVGLRPEMLVAATMSVPVDEDEYAVAGGFSGEAYPVAPCGLPGLLVPAEAEYLIEGYIDPRERIDEGPFTEYDLIASQVTDGFRIHVEAIRTKEDPIFHSLVCTSLEMVSLIMPLAMTEMQKTREFLKWICPNVKDLFMLPGVPGTGLAVSIYKHSEADSHDIIRGLFSFSARLKRIVVVDDDIDVHDPMDVQWAIDTRVVDLHDHVILKAAGEFTDAARVGDFSVKQGIDATRKKGHPHGAKRSATEHMEAVELRHYLRAQ